MNLQLSQVKLERFKAAFKPEPIDFRPFNVIIGMNGSGKSTVLEALQWIDTALRQDVRQACDPYNGIHDLVNLRSQTKELYFEIGLKWDCLNSPGNFLDYWLKVAENKSKNLPTVSGETLSLSSIPPVQSVNAPFIFYDDMARYVRSTHRLEYFVFTDTDRLALNVATASQKTVNDSEDKYLIALRKFWRGAVFLRLSPLALAGRSAPSRKSFEPLMDQEGRLLPALLSELTSDQMGALAESIRSVLPDIRGIEVTPSPKRGEDVSFSLLERMPYRGRTGRHQLPIPAWMLSEGTRRITAILSLLQHKSPPSLLCIEEIENGLDPWSVVKVVQKLREASRRGIQVILTTHSPWLLDHVGVEEILQVKRLEGETVYERFAELDDVKSYQGRATPGAIYVNEG